jgi:hypothetical protein
MVSLTPLSRCRLSTCLKWAINFLSDLNRDSRYLPTPKTPGEMSEVPYSPGGAPLQPQISIE